tara:strand:- start:246 stop:635 length:390 start_codon:yes stop_codon:yes gene_type:complete
MIAYLSLICCKSANNDSENEPHAIPSIYQDTTMTNSYNADKTLKLTLEKNNKKGDPASHFEYRVYSIPENKLVKEGTFRGSGIIWNDNTSLKLIPYVGMVKKQQLGNPDDIASDKKNNKEIIIRINKNQ